MDPRHQDGLKDLMAKIQEAQLYDDMRRAAFPEIPNVKGEKRTPRNRCRKPKRQRRKRRR